MFVDNVDLIGLNVASESSRTDCRSCSSSIGKSTPDIPKPTNGTCLVRDLVERDRSGLSGGLGSWLADFFERLLRSSLGRREPRPSEPGELKRLVTELRLIDGFRRRLFHDDFLEEGEKTSEEGELKDVDVFGDEVAGLVGVEGGIIIKAGSGNISRGSSRSCLMRASRFRVVSEVQSDGETRSVGRL